MCLCLCLVLVDECGAFGMCFVNVMRECIANRLSFVSEHMQHIPHYVWSNQSLAHCSTSIHTIKMIKNDEISVRIVYIFSENRFLGVFAIYRLKISSLVTHRM